MANVLQYAQRHPRDEVRYSSLPRWVYTFNGAAIVLALTIHFFGFATNWTLNAVGCLLLIPQFLFLTLPSMWEILFAKRIDPRERVIAFLMTLAAMGGMVFGTWFGLNWGWCC